MDDISIMVTIGKYGGFYIHNGYTKRICLGWIALTYMPCDLMGIIGTDNYKNK